MANEGNFDISEFLDPNGHEALPQRKKKQSTRGQKKPQGKAYGLERLFDPRTTDEKVPDPNASLVDLLGKRESVAPPPFSIEHAVELPLLQKRSEWESAAAVQPMKQYSNEARTYHAQYASLSEAHDEGNYDVCRQGCLSLLFEPNLPHYTRVQTLQMLSTLVQPSPAEGYLHEAGELLSKLDQTKFQVQLLKEDNDKMLADLHSWRFKKGLVGKDLEAEDYDEEEYDRPAASYWRFDRDVEEKNRDELAENMEHMGFGQPVVTSGDEPVALETKWAHGLPSPPDSPTLPAHGSKLL